MSGQEPARGAAAASATATTHLSPERRRRLRRDLLELLLKAGFAAGMAFIVLPNPWNAVAAVALMVLWGVIALWAIRRARADALAEAAARPPTDPLSPPVPPGPPAGPPAGAGAGPSRSGRRPTAAPPRRTR